MAESIGGTPTSGADSIHVASDERTALAMLQGYLGLTAGITGVLLFFLYPGSIMERSLIAMQPQAHTNSCMLLIVIVAVIALLLMRNLGKALGNNKARDIVNIVTLVCGFAPLCFLISNLYIPGCVLAGIGMVGLGFTWTMFFINYEYSTLVTITASSFALAGVIAAVLFLLKLPVEAIYIVCTAALLISWASHQLAVRRAHQAEKNIEYNWVEGAPLTAKTDRWTYSLIGIDFGYTISYCYYCYTVGPSGLEYNFSFEIWTAVLFAPFIIACICELVLHSRKAYLLESYAKDFLTFTVSLGLILIMVGSPITLVVGLVVLLSGTFLQILIVINASACFIRLQNLSPFWYLKEMTFIAVGILVGITLVHASCVNRIGFFTPAMASGIMILINAFMQVFINRGAFPSEKLSIAAATAMDAVGLGAVDTAIESQLPSVFSEDSHEPKHSGKGYWHAQVDYCCKKYDLSKRQCEIFELLAKGRDAKYIEDKLCISHATTKSHTYNIYVKMGIHSRQELMDIVEATDPYADEDSAERAAKVAAANSGANYPEPHVKTQPNVTA